MKLYFSVYGVWHILVIAKYTLEGIPLPKGDKHTLCWSETIVCGACGTTNHNPVVFETSAEATAALREMLGRIYRSQIPVSNRTGLYLAHRLRINPEELN